MKKVLVTGASGFIGYNTVLEFLKRGCFVYALVHYEIRPELLELEIEKKINIIKSDVTEYKSLLNVFNELPKLDAIIHCAGRASDVGKDKEFRKTNYESVKHLVELVKIFNVKRLVFVSTTDVYGIRNFNEETELELPFAENAKNPYPKYKIKAEKWIKERLSEDRYCIIRPAAVWGEDDPILTKRIKDFLSSSRFIIHFGRWKGHNRWPLAHVKDVAHAIYIGAFHPDSKGLAINVIDEKKTTIDEFYRFVANKYFPNKTFKSITLPFWVGLFISSIITFISNIFNLKRPFMDPSIYALYSVSRNLDFSGSLFISLKMSLNQKELENHNFP